MTVKVVVTTYCPEVGHPRGEYLSRVLESLDLHLHSPEGRHFVIANDGDPDQPHIKNIKRFGENVTVVGGPRAGIGGSLNRAIQATVLDSDLWLYTTDDWLLTERLDLTQPVRLMREAGYGYVRLGPPHPNVRTHTAFMQGLGWWLNLSTDDGGFVFATRPFLCTLDFYKRTGSFLENCDSYVCERDYADRVNRLWAGGLAETVHGSLEGPWEHIGVENVGERYP